MLIKQVLKQYRAIFFAFWLYKMAMKRLISPLNLGERTFIDRITKRLR